MTGCLVLSLFLMIYLWPAQKEDGTKFNPCYCFSPAFWSGNRRNNVQNEQFINEKAAALTDSKYVTRNEQEYIDRGDMETPSIQSYIETDDNYLDNALRIIDL